MLSWVSFIFPITALPVFPLSFLSQTRLTIFWHGLRGLRCFVFAFESGHPDCRGTTSFGEGSVFTMKDMKKMKN